MSENVLPQKKYPKLIVVVAFDRAEDGDLFTAFGPVDQQTEERAIRTAKGLAGQHAGVIAWSREARPDIGGYETRLTERKNASICDQWTKR